MWVVVLAALILLPATALAQAPTRESLIEQLRPREGANETRGVFRMRRPQVSLQVQFGFDSTVLTPQAIAVLDTLGAAMNSRELAGFRFRIVGHTDARGTEAYNVDLSRKRADRVRAYLIGRWNVSPMRLETEGRGFTELVMPSRPQAPENRRVQVVNEGALE
jgi:outer membrane protein OmpA-like peptidoglycan-associated protein